MSAYEMWQADAERWGALKREHDELLAMLRRFVEPGRDIRRFPDAYAEGRALVARIDGEAQVCSRCAGKLTRDPGETERWCVNCGARYEAAP